MNDVARLKAHRVCSNACETRQNMGIGRAYNTHLQRGDAIKKADCPQVPPQPPPNGDVPNAPEPPTSPELINPPPPSNNGLLQITELQLLAVLAKDDNNKKILERVRAGQAIIKIGDKGGVEIVQELLERHGFYLERIDGDFGTETGQTVREFQAAKGIEEDGVVGQNTLGKLESKPTERIHAVVRGDSLKTIADRYKTTVEQIFNLNSDQITDPDKIEIDQKLKVWVPPEVEISEAPASTPSGAQVTPAREAPTHIKNPYDEAAAHLPRNTVVKQGDYNSVAAGYVQKGLFVLGYKPEGASREEFVDRHYGSTSEKYMSQFQKENMPTGCKNPGVYDENTRQAMLRVLAKRSAEAEELKDFQEKLELPPTGKKDRTTEIALGLPYPPLPNDDRTAAAKLHQALTRLKYEVGSDKESKVFGNHSKFALKQFQKSAGLEETGVYDTATLGALAKAIAAVEAKERESPGKLLRPSPNELTSPWGWRTYTDRNGARKSGFHAGIDFARWNKRRFSDPNAYATAKGTVVRAHFNKSYGNTVIVAHGEIEPGYRIYSLYAHLKEMDVKPGQQIKAGHDLGEIGNTGVSRGPHLHFEIIRIPIKDEFRFQNAEPIGLVPKKHRVNPEKYMKEFNGPEPDASR